jgi:hypothetical protein
MQANNCAIVINSCDKYSDAWDPFFTLFFRYWPDCPLRLILISNGLEYKDARVATHKIINDLGWSGNLIETLKSIPEEYIIYMQEDYFLKEKVDNEKVLSALKLMTETNAAYLRFYPCPGPDLPFGNNQEVGTISRAASYRNSTQASIWDKQVLFSLLNSKETGWDFETKGGLERSRQIERPFLAYKKPIINYICTAIEKGQYRRDAIKFCKKEGIIINTKRIKPQPWWQPIKNTLKTWKKYFQKT